MFLIDVDTAIEFGIADTIRDTKNRAVSRIKKAVRGTKNVFINPRVGLVNAASDPIGRYIFKADINDRPGIANSSVKLRNRVKIPLIAGATAGVLYGGKKLFFDRKPKTEERTVTFRPTY